MRLFHNEEERIVETQRKEILHFEQCFPKINADKIEEDVNGISTNVEKLNQEVAAAQNKYASTETIEKYSCIIYNRDGSEVGETHEIVVQRILKQNYELITVIVGELPRPQGLVLNGYDLKIDPPFEVPFPEFTAGFDFSHVLAVSRFDATTDGGDYPSYPSSYVELFKDAIYMNELNNFPIGSITKFGQYQFSWIIRRS